VTGRQPGPPARVELRVSPGAARNEIVGRYGEGWKVRVAVRAERGRANQELLEFLAATLGVRPARLRLVTGQGARDKLVEIDGMTRDEADRLLSARRKGNG
jgi:uncharacterized protein (TIGR00251 family)